MNTKKFFLIFIITLISIILCATAVSANDYNTTTEPTLSENNAEVIDDTIDNDNKLEAKEYSGCTYDQEVEIQVEDITIQKIHKETYIYEKTYGSESWDNEFPDKQISVRFINLDYNESDKWSIQYPANVPLTFNVYENSKIVSTFSKRTDAYGYVNFSSKELPEKVGAYTVIVSYSGKEKNFSFDNDIYYEYLPVEKTFNVIKTAPEHTYVVTDYWGGQKYSVTIKLNDKQYQSLKTAKKNKKSKEIIDIHTNKYIAVKITTSKKLVTCKITKNKKTGKLKKQWTKNWKAKKNKLIKQGYKAKTYKKVSKNGGKIWIVFKKTTKKKYEIKASIFTVAKNGQYKKGDYLCLYGPEPMRDIRITI